MNEQGLHDSAILLMALGEDAAADVFRHLAPKEVQRLGEAMSRTRTTSRERLQSVLDRFHSDAGDLSTLVEDTDEYIRSVLQRALGEDKAGLLIERILQGGDVSGIESLKWMDPQSVAELIRNEHPQIIASILVHLERDQASAVLMQLTERLRHDVMVRIATLDGIQPNALRELNDVLMKVLAGGEKLKRKKLGGTKAAAEILNFFGGSNETAVLDAIREHDADLAQRIADQMFTFEDLNHLDDRAIQLLLREVQNESLIVALKGADGELRERVFRNMSQRAAETMREDLESKGPVRLSEVEAEQKEILKIVRRLADEGQIALGGGGEDAFV
ncbi:MAG: flagellar motor switch protein FliG [Burkholderiales bacterium]|nr:flagellar motor switch protein FliG [Burkholderiales bacterium]OJX09095.1 MAG: flagellar motor switch protein FliG [Burkholderiales bacterium 70-64]